MKYIGGGANIITVDYKQYDGFEFGEFSHTYVFADYGLAYCYFKREVERAMYNHETETDNNNRDIDECLADKEAVFDKVCIDWKVATFVKRDND